MPLIGALERGGQKSVVRHAQQHARGGSGAGEYARKHADECTAVDGDPERRNPSLRGEKVQGAGGIAERRGCAAEADHLRVGAEHEEDAGEQRALQHGAGNRLERLARLATQRGGAFKAGKTEDGEHECRSQSFE